MRAIHKRFPGVQALSGASFDLRPGEIHALVGENGAGKSTLIKILSGVLSADSGSIELLGQPVTFGSPAEARRAGISTIFQEFTLIPSLSVTANLFLGREQTRGILIDIAEERRNAMVILDRLGVSIDVDAPTSQLAVAVQQMVEIGRALAGQSRILVMDEPTAALSPQEVQRLFSILRELAAQGVGTLFISHRLDEVISVADRITVIRDGITVDSRATREYDRRTLIQQMVGRPIEQEYPKTQTTFGEISLEVVNLTAGNVRDVSFSAREGEIVGLAGLMGSGRTEVVRLIFGADSAESGVITLAGRRVKIKCPGDAVASGICLLTEDRKKEGLVLHASIRDNFALPSLAQWSRLGFINQVEENRRFETHVLKLNIRISSPDQHAEDLSGGNQQKLLVARWLEKDSSVIMFDEPTRGIDVGAKHEMYLLIGELAARGKTIIMVSSELLELLGICDRILVMRRGRLAGEITDVRHSSQEDVMAMAV
jgi:ABC-type sugar transport system ATPase subunit